MAEVVKGWARGGATIAERELGWNRRTIRKGMQELDHGMSIADSFRLRGRKPTEDKLPNLLEDIRSPVPSPQSPVPSPQSPVPNAQLIYRFIISRSFTILIKIKVELWY
jgi:hypothetical protein